MRLFSVMCAGLVVACSGETVDDDGTTTTPTGTVPCDAIVKTVDPPANAAGVRVDKDIAVTFDMALPEGGNWSLDIAGVVGTSELAGDRMSARFVADADFEYETVYTITATACDDTKSANFLTQPQPVEPTSLENVTYGILEDDLVLTNPKGADAFLAFLGEDGLFGTLAFQLTDYDEGEQTFGGVGAVLEPDSDDFFCDQLVNTEVGFRNNPFLTFGPDDLTIEVDTDEFLDLEDLEVRGRIAADGKSLIEPVVSLALAIEEVPSPVPLQACEAFAKLLPNLGIECVPCESSDSGQCVLLEASVPSADVIARDIVKECAPD